MITLCYEDNNKIMSIDNLDIIKSLIGSTEKLCFITVINPTETEIDILSQLFKLHIITLKNIVTKKQIPKVEIYDNYLSTIIYDVEDTDSQNCYSTNPICLVLMKNITLILAKKDFNAITEIHSRFLSNPKNAFTSASNLYYIAIDVLVDNLFPILACFENKLDILQENILQNKGNDNNNKILLLRKNFLKLERIFSFEQEILFKLSHEDIKFVSKEQTPYIKDIYHHLEKLNANLKEYIDWASNLYNAYMAYSSSKTEDKLNLLTIISFIFMPLSTISGWYGMNFSNMPELNFKYGYFCLIGVVVICILCMIIYFKNKKML